MTTLVVALLAAYASYALVAPALVPGCLNLMTPAYWLVFTLAHLSRLNSKTRGTGRSANDLDRRASPDEASVRALSSVASWRFSGFEKPEPGNPAPRASTRP
jgi:hypothetical protein